LSGVFNQIKHLAGVDWTYGNKGWAAENIVCFWRMTKPGNTLPEPQPNRRMTWVVKSFSIPSEVM
jgi:hypothetical protein